MTSSEEEIRIALEGVLKLYDVKLEKPPGSDSEEKLDYAEAMSKTQEKLDKLTEQAEEIYRRTGMTRDQLEAYATNPNNFTPEQWEALQKVREACEKHKQEARSRLPQFEQTVETQERKKQPQRFAKKKHWLPT